MSDLGDRPISALVSQGWEVKNYFASLGSSGTIEHCFHMARRTENKVVRLREKMMGKGVVAEELDV